MAKSIQERLNGLERKYKNLCCTIVNNPTPEAAGCISFTDITWDAFLTAVENGSIADCYYNITDRPNSGEDPLYVLVEKGFPNFDNEVRRGQQALASFCVGENADEAGCFNIYATTPITFVPFFAACTILVKCDTSNYVGTVAIIETTPPISVTIVAENDGLLYLSECPLDVMDITIEFFDGVRCVVEGEAISVRPCTLPVLGDLICASGGLQATITNIDAITGAFTILPITGSWIGVSTFFPCDDAKCDICMPLYTPVSFPLNSEPICFSAKTLGQGPYSSQMLLASDGNLYGVLSESPVETGQLYRLDPVTEIITVLWEFLGNVGGYGPRTSLVEEAGIIYGTTARGGIDDEGTIWQYEIATALFSTIHSFDYINGSQPYSGQVILSGSALGIYGVTQYGGNNDAGVIYYYEIATGTFIVLLYLYDYNILYPQGTLVEVLPGILWGTSYEGGAFDVGTVFQYDTTNGDLTIIYSAYSEGEKAVYLSGGVFLASDGNVYVQTFEGGLLGDERGLLLKFSNIGITNDVSIVARFTIDKGGYSDAVRPVEIGGILYGVTSQVGNNPITHAKGEGTLWSYNLSTEVFEILYYFDGTTVGDSPHSSLQVVGTNLYGLTTYDDVVGKGSIFKFDTLTNEMSLVHYLASYLGSSSDLATLVCSAIDNPAYVCTVIGGCVYVTGTQFAEDNGQILEVRTLYTLEYSLFSADPTIGNTLIYASGDSSVLGTIVDVDTLTQQMKVEWSSLFVPSVIVPFSYQELENSNAGVIDSVLGSQVIYTATPFTGGDPFPHNMPCYYNSVADIIVDYPMSQAFTKTEIQKFIEDQTLVPGAFYYIKGLDAGLYGGTSCILQASTPNKFNVRGMGLFHTPKYEVYSIFSPLENYVIGDTVIWGGQEWTAQEDFAPTPAFSSFFISPAWSSGATTSIIFVAAANLIGSWNIGDEIDAYGLPGLFILDMYIGQTPYSVTYLVVSSAYNYSLPTTINNITTGGTLEWSEGELVMDIPNNIGYTEQWDEITYDQDGDFITSRKDLSQNYVEQSFQGFIAMQQTLSARSITAFQWGRPFTFFGGAWIVGNKGNTVIESLFYTLNFKGHTLQNNKLEIFSTVSCNGTDFLYSDLIGNTFRNSQMFNITTSFDWTIMFHNTFINSYVADSDISVNSWGCIFTNCELVLLTGTVGTLLNLNFEHIYASIDISLSSSVYVGIDYKVFQDSSGAVRIMSIDGSGNATYPLITI